MRCSNLQKKTKVPFDIGWARGSKTLIYEPMPGVELPRYDLEAEKPPYRTRSKITCTVDSELLQKFYDLALETHRADRTGVKFELERLLRFYLAVNGHLPKYQDPKKAKRT